MGKVEPNDIAAALERQKTTAEKTRLGEILIRTGKLPQAELELALEAQRLLRSKSKHERTMGAMKLSRLSTRSVMDLSISIEEEARRNTETVTVIAGGKK